MGRPEKIVSMRTHSPALEKLHRAFISVHTTLNIFSGEILLCYRGCQRTQVYWLKIITMEESFGV